MEICEYDKMSSDFRIKRKLLYIASGALTCIMGSRVEKRPDSPTVTRVTQSLQLSAPQVTQALFGTVDMTLRKNSVIIRVCMGV